MYNKLVLTLILAGVLLQAYGDLPPEIQKCKSSDNDECVGKAMMQIMELYPHGNPEIGLVDVASLPLKELVLSESKDPNAPVKLDFKFNTVVVSGLEKFQAKRVHGFNKNVSKTIDFDIYVPKIIVEGDYVIDGKILLLPLKGQGRGKVVFSGADFKFKSKLSTEKRNDKTYAFVTKFKLHECKPEKITFELENIVKDNKVLSESINGVINENWRDIWEEIKPTTVKAVETVLTDIINGIFRKLSIDDFYID